MKIKKEMINKKGGMAISQILILVVGVVAFAWGIGFVSAEGGWLGELSIGTREAPLSATTPISGDVWYKHFFDFGTQNGPF